MGGHTIVLIFDYLIGRVNQFVNLRHLIRTMLLVDLGILTDIFIVIFIFRKKKENDVWGIVEEKT